MNWYPLSVPTIGDEEIAATVRVLASGDTTMGPLVEQFEAAFARQVGAAHAVMVNSGSSANLLIAQALAVSDGRNEVLVPAVTWPTQAWPWVMAGFTVRLVDVNPLTLNAEAEDFAAAITPQTRVISAVHLMGNPCRMEALQGLARDHDLLIVEDCCEALGASYMGRPVGTFGESASWSFFFSHHITTMEGGMVTTNRADLADRYRALRSHGWNRHNPLPDHDPMYTFVDYGYNLRPTEVNAAIGLVQLRRLPTFLAQRARNHTTFIDQILGLGLRVPRHSRYGDPSWFGFPLVVTPHARRDRDELATHLRENGVETRPILGGNLARQPIGKHFAHGPLPGADEIHDRGLFIGLHPLPDDMERLVDVVSR